MGRVLEALRRDSWAKTPVLPFARPAAEEPPEEEVPFIEVGPRKWMDGSASVLAKAPAAKLSAAPTDAEPVLAPTEAPAARAAAPEPLSVRLRPVTVPAVAKVAPELVAYHSPNHALSCQYRELVGALTGEANAEAQRASIARTLLFTAVRGEVGTTTVVLNVAVSAAQLGQTVIVVDANLRRPGVARALGLGETPGLREVLSGAATLDQAIRHCPQAGLLALPAGVKPVTTIRPNADAIRSLLGRLRQRADLVLVDAPSWDGRPELVALGAACDAVYLVLPDSEADCPEAESMCQLIPEQGGRLAGCILSRH